MSTSLTGQSAAATPAAPSTRAAARAAAGVSVRPLVVAGLVLGLGIGVFFDGIVLHQILGWHHLICEQRTCHPTSIADLQRKNVSDGYFHLGTYLLTIAGVGLLFRAGRRTSGPLWSGPVLAGAILAGFGLFNLVEGIIDHHLLQIHHVRPRSANPLAWDLGFLASGVLMALVGAALIRRGGAGSSSGSGGQVLAAATSEKGLA